MTVANRCDKPSEVTRTIVVDDVNTFPDHIVCDSASASEIAVPLIVDGRAIGVFDVDAPIPARFSDADRVGIETLVARFLRAVPIDKERRFA